MEVIISGSQEEASRRAAEGIRGVISAKGGYAVLGLATGSSPKGLYAELVSLYQRGVLSFREVRCFALDEYVGLPADHPSSYRSYVRQHFAERVDVPEAHVDVLRGYVKDLRHEALRYEQAIRDSGGIDIQILGIGMDGHIGFNEPSSSLSSRTRVKTLSAQTVQDNAVHFPPGERVPEHVLTMGIGTILDARQIYLLAFGASKAGIVARALEGPISASVPASALQLHERVTVFLDEESARELALRDYYKRVFKLKPDWQR